METATVYDEHIIVVAATPHGEVLTMKVLVRSLTPRTRKVNPVFIGK